MLTEISYKSFNNMYLKFFIAMEKAIIFLEKRELPPHWDRDILFSHGEQESTNNSTTASSESDPDDDDEEDDEEGKL